MGRGRALAGIALLIAGLLVGACGRDLPPVVGTESISAGERGPAFVSLASSSADAAVVGLNVTDDDAAARAFATEFGIPYPSIADPDGTLLRTIPGVPPSSLPSTVILDRQGRVAARIIGAATYDGVSSLVAEIGSESAPTATTGQAP